MIAVMTDNLTETGIHTDTLTIVTVPAEIVIPNIPVTVRALADGNQDGMLRKKLLKNKTETPQNGC